MRKLSKRLSILNSSNDGFEIAAKDMELRGPGDLLGVRQSGMMDFKIADIYQGIDIFWLRHRKRPEEFYHQILIL